MEAIVSFVFIFLISWWVVLFFTLPLWLDNKRLSDAELKDAGDVSAKKLEVSDLANSSAAPDNPQLKKKFIVTTVISFIISLIIYNFASYL